MKYMGNNSLSALVATLKQKFAALTHTHSPNDLTSAVPVAKGGTGAATRAEAFKNLSFTNNYNCTKKSEDGTYYTDLDDFKDPGFYYVNASGAQLISNYSLTNGYLIVLPSSSADGRVKQLLYRHGTKNSNDHMSFVRTYFGSSTGWSDWVKFITSKDLATTSAAGLMSSADKAKLDSIEVNTGLSSVNGEEPSMSTMDIPKDFI